MAKKSTTKIAPVAKTLDSSEEVSRLRDAGEHEAATAMSRRLSEAAHVARTLAAQVKD